MEVPSHLPEHEFVLEEEGESVYDNIVGIVVEQGRMIGELITCLAEGSIAELDPVPEPNLNSSLLDYIKDGGLYDFLNEEPNTCHREAEVLELKPKAVTEESDSEEVPTLPEPEIIVKEPELIGDQEAIPVEIVKPKVDSAVAPNVPLDKKPKCCKCSIL